MNFNSLYNKLEIIEEARAGRFENLFQTGYLKKAMMDKGVGVPRPLVFQFIMDFLESKGLVPEGTAFKGSRYAAEAGEFIKKLVDEGMIKDEIADEFKEYTKNNLGDFIGRKFQTTKHRTGEFAKKQQMEGGEERGKAAGELRKVKTAEELAAEREAKKATKGELESALGSLEKLETQNNVIIAVSLQGEPFEPEKMLSTITKMLKGYGGTPVDLQYSDQPPGVVVTFDINSKWSNVLDKKGIDGTQQIITNGIANTTGLQPDEFDVSVGSPTTELMRSATEKAREQKAANQPRKKFDADTQGHAMGAIEPDQSAEWFKNPSQDEEEPVTENAKPKVQFISNKDRFQPKTFWQKVAQQEMFYR